MEPPDVSSEYQDRKTGLVVFGVMTLLVGLLCALFVPLVFFGQAMAPQAAAGQNAHTILPAAMMYGGMAVLFIWLGVGSIMARRWARALLLVLAWSWLCIGVISLVVVAFILPKIMEDLHAAQPAGQPAMPPEMGSIVTVVMLAFLSVIYVVIPAIWVLFYRSRHVKATCEALDPVVRWTDRCPLPVIAVCLWMGLSCLTMIMMAVAFKGVIPMFGSFVVGPLGSALYLLVALIFGYSAWAMYHLRWSGWWLIFACMCLFAVSAFITYSRHDIMELYVLMGYSEQELARLRQFNFLKGGMIAWSTLCGMLPFVGYMLFLRRYFPARDSLG